MGLYYCIQNFKNVITCNIYQLLYRLVNCPGEYPTTIDILITNLTDDTTIQNINDVLLMKGSQDNILTTVDNITLQSDMIYTIIEVSFSNLDGEFNITSSVNISKCISHLPL